MEVDRVRLLALRQTVGVYGNVDPGQTFYASEDAAKELVKMGSAKLVDAILLPPPDEEKLAPAYANKAMSPPSNKEAAARKPRQPPPTAQEEPFTISPSISPRI